MAELNPDATQEGSCEEATDDLDEELDSFEEDLLRRCSSRLSEILPRRLRFSVAPAGLGPPTFSAGHQQCSTAGTTRPLQVYVRVRPPCTRSEVPAGSQTVCITAASSTQLCIRPSAKQGVRAVPGELYTFTEVLPESSSQQQAYEATAARMVSDLLQFRSQSSVIMAYGSSGAGKTFSIEGTATEPGLLPQALHNIMQGLPEGVQASVSYFEVYGDAVYDLLSPSVSVKLGGPSGAVTNSSSTMAVPSQSAGNHEAGVKDQVARVPGPPRPPRPPKPGAGVRQGNAAGMNKMLKHTLLQHTDPAARNALRVREDSSGQIVIPGLTGLRVQDAAQAAQVQLQGARYRQQAATRVNHTSSRSHCVFTITLQERAADSNAATGGRTAKLSFVDLAGSERVGRTGNQGERFKESISINSSLMTLARCMEVLRVNQQLAAQQQQPGSIGGQPPAVATQAGTSTAGMRRVPYRESKLTHLFRDVLHGQGALVLLVAVSPMAEDYEESSHVLRYAAAATGISCTVLPPPAPAPADMSSVPSSVPGALEDSTAAQGTHPAVGAPQAADTTTLVAAAQEQENAALRARVAELETSLHNATVQLHDTQAALEEAEADIREDVVAEISSVIQDLRESYDTQIAELQSQLQSKDQEMQQLRALLDAARTHTQQQGSCERHSAGAEGTVAGAFKQQQEQTQQECLRPPQQPTIPEEPAENRPPACEKQVQDMILKEIADSAAADSDQPAAHDAQAQVLGVQGLGCEVRQGHQGGGRAPGSDEVMQQQVLTARDANVDSEGTGKQKRSTRQRGKRQRAPQDLIAIDEDHDENGAGLRRSKRHAV